MERWEVERKARGRAGSLHSRRKPGESKDGRRGSRREVGTNYFPFFLTFFASPSPSPFTPAMQASTREKFIAFSARFPYPLPSLRNASLNAAAEKRETSLKFINME